MLLRILCCTALLAAAIAPAAGVQHTDAREADRANPILVPGAPWYFEAFTVDVPQGKDWASYSKSAAGAELENKSEDGRIATAVIESSRLEEDGLREDDLLRLSRRLHTAPPAPGTTRLLTFDQEVTTRKGGLCVRSSARFEDRQPQSDTPGALVVRSLICIRPDKPQMLVSLRFAERCADVDGIPALTEQAERFFSSLRFIATDTARLSQARGAVANQRRQDALDLLEPAAEQGDAEALVFLGNMYLHGTGVDQDARAARRHFEQAARMGHRDALFNLGAMYDKAIGVQRDPAEAIKWFTRAADQRDAAAQLNLAIFHWKGDGVPRDQALAEQWLRRAAGNGSTRAQGMLSALKRDEAGAR